MAKKKKRWEGIVYSTDPDFDGGHEEDDVIETLPPNKQTLRIYLDRLKGNKLLTRIDDFQGTDDDLKDLGKQLKQLCGCGGSTKKGQILLQGSFRDKVADKLRQMGYKVKLAGG
ncbi:MAG: translation initiation factor [Bacteroidota bacterium]